MNTPAGRHAAGTPLFAALQRPECYPHPAPAPRVIETHISWVILTGEYAYKIKKPVNLGFANFTTLGLRRYYCEEELRLNRRLAPGLYLEVVTIRGDARAPRVGGEGAVLDYAVKMKEFPQEALASRKVAAGTLAASDVDALATLVAEFHERAPAARPAERFGAPEAAQEAALQNFEQMLPLVKSAPEDRALRELRRWTEHEFAARKDALAARKRAGFVRECHGDLHLGNIAMIESRPVPFDCIEFNDELRWIDVMSEAAFLAMDLVDRGRSDLAWRFLNRYLEATGDYAGVPLLRYYLVYRALVRAKVHLMRSRQPRLLRATRARLSRAFQDYLQLAGRFAATQRPALVLTHGVSGCGKTTVTQPLAEQLGAIRIRSDLERKRLHGVAPLSSSGSALAGGIYTAEATAATYRRLGALAQDVLGAGFPAVVDATFLKRAEREAFRAIAGRLEVPFLILDIHAPQEALRARIAARRAHNKDASEADLAVLERQLSSREPLTPAEIASAIVVDGTAAATAETWRAAIERIRRVIAPAGRKQAPPV